MEDDTTTSVVDDTQAAQEPQLEDTTDNTEAVDDSTETSQTSDSGEADPLEDKSDEAEIKEWAAKKNLPLDDPIKIAKMYRESEKELGRKGQEAGQLGKQAQQASETAGLDDLQALRNQVAVMDFYMNNPDARQYDTKMGEILESKPYLVGDLDTLLLVAKAQTSDEELLAARQAGKKEALAAAAQAERAGAPKATATTRQTPGKLTDEDVANMSLQEYEAAVSSGKITPWDLG